MKYLLFFTFLSTNLFSATPETALLSSIVMFVAVGAILVNLIIMFASWFILIGMPISAFYRSNKYFKRNDEENSKSGSVSPAFTTAKAAGVTVMVVIIGILISRLLFIDILALDKVHGEKFGGVISKVFLGKAFSK